MKYFITRINFTFLALLLSYFTCSAQSIGDYQVYYGHLHNHTGYSDGEETPEEAYTHARDVAGLDFMGIAEHGILMSSSEWSSLKEIANDINSDGEFITFWGFEWSSNSLYGHVSVVNTDDYTNAISTFSFSDLKSWLDNQDGIAFFNHPGREDNGLEFTHFESDPNDSFVGIELWNKSTGFEEYYYNDGYHSDDNGMGFYDEALQRGWKIGALGSHDHHGTSWGETDRAMAILANELTRTALFEAIKERRFYSTEDRSIALSFTSNNAEMGSTIEENSAQLLQIETYDSEGENFTTIELYRNGELFYIWDINDVHPILSKSITPSEGEYYYVKITQGDGDEAISSPIFFENLTGNTPPAITLSSPEHSGAYSQGATINFAADASDTDGSVSKVEFYNGTTKIGEDNSAPYQYNWLNVDPGTYYVSAKATDNDGTTKYSLVSKITVEASDEITTSSRINDENDDAEEGWSGYMYTSSSDLELVYDDWLTGDQLIGLRFEGLNIPKGATITSAYIQFTVDETSSESTEIKIQGEKSTNPASFTSSDPISSRSRTSASVTWDIPEWNSVGAKSDDQRTPDLKDLIQEIINQDGYTISNALAIIISGDGKRIAEAYDGDADNAAFLTVSYTTATSSTDRTSSSTTERPDISVLQIFPNPFNDQITIQTSENDLSISAYNYDNMRIGVKAVKTQSGYRIRTEDWASGYYILQIGTSQKNYTFRVLKK